MKGNKRMGNREVRYFTKDAKTHRFFTQMPQGFVSDQNLTVKKMVYIGKKAKKQGSFLY